jgi:alanine dehydrogenase
MGAQFKTSPGPVFVSAEAVAASVDVAEAIAELRRVYLTRAATGRDAERVVARGSGGARIRALAAVLPTGDLMGAKLHVQPTGAGSSYLIALFSQTDGTLLGLVDGQAVTELRTGATSAVALDALAAPGPLRVAILGSGVEARSHLRAVAATRELEQVHVFSPTRERRERFAADLGEQLAVEVQCHDSADAAVCAGSTVIAAARSRGERPIFDPGSLNAGTVVVSIGSTLPEQRELDERVLERAALVIADEPSELLRQSGDCLAAAAAGIELAGKTFPLSALLQNALPTAVDHGALNLFKSVGSALQDVSVAGLILSRAIETGRCIPLEVNLSSKEKRG